jgi:hypothetical protein
VKRCSKCGVERAEWQFYNHPTTGKLRASCRLCAMQYERAHYDSAKRARKYQDELRKAAKQ